MNENTWIPQNPAAPSISTDDLRRAYNAAVRFATTLTPDAAYALMWIRENEMGMRSLAYGESAIVGRHTQSDMQLLRDPEVALRHLMVRAVKMAEGPALRVLDLHTARGFHLEDDVQRRALVASGPVAMRVGTYSLIAIPAQTPAPASLPKAVIEEMVSLERSPYRSLSPRVSHTSRITLMPRASSLGDLSVGEPCAMLGVERNGACQWIGLSVSDLHRGVMIGRADRCESSVRALLSDSVSRVHALILRDGDETFIHDLSSTHGVLVDKARVRRVPVLANGETLVSLGQDVRLLMRPLAS